MPSSNIKITSIRYQIILLVVTALLLLPACQSSTEPQPQSEVPDQSPAQAEPEGLTPADSPEIPTRGFFMGVLPTPIEGTSFEDVYRRTSGHSEFVPVWGRPTPFYDMAEDLSGGWGQTFVEHLIRGNNMFPLVHLSFIGAGMTLASPTDIAGATLSNKEWREAYKQAAIEVVKAARPLYLSIGNEVNRWFDKYGAGEDNPDGFQYYVSLYEEMYDEIKALSPETRVFCIFSREIVDENREADMEVLRMFNPDKIDILVLTSYPHSVQGINSPSDIPDDYYSRVFNYMDAKPLGFSEITWPSHDAFGGEHGQAVFLGHLSGRLTLDQGIDLHLVGWPWLNDLAEADDTGLIKLDGTPKQAYDTWRSISLSGQNSIK